MTRNISKCKNGFSLIEALIAIGILIVGILSAFLLLVRTTSTIPAMQERLRAVNLAQEGIELVRALRDSDFVSGVVGGFKDFLPTDECQREDNCQIDVNSSGNIDLVTNANITPLIFHTDSFLYNYNSSGSTEESIFSRQIIIDSNQDDWMDVTVEVEYSIKGKEQIIIATDRLYNWLNPTP
ncbi:MAG: prepilin-type N-terminal cleavage/methylation domain-containing protein [Candidatus Parcubacteria bacterium]|nr:prepilin-type N-terminal cleavage/methylation domain-containing protein [Candidatus Parcubacteria bacterium]